jgi:hypothetical protein
MALGSTQTLGGGAWGWRPHHILVPNVMKIWEPKPPETLWATPGLLRDSFYGIEDRETGVRFPAGPKAFFFLHREPRAVLGLKQPPTNGVLSPLVENGARNVTFIGPISPHNVTNLFSFSTLHNAIYDNPPITLWFPWQPLLTSCVLSVGSALLPWLLRQPLWQGRVFSVRYALVVRNNYYNRDWMTSLWDYSYERIDSWISRV